MKILVLNAGSSSHKLSLFEFGDTLPNSPAARLWEARKEWRNGTAHTKPVTDLVRTLWSGPSRVIDSPEGIYAVGHRIVHGGPQYEEPVRITPAVKQGIASVSEFAPLHNRAELGGIEAIDKLLDGVPQVAVFDTGFHRRMPLPATVYPGPYEWFTKDIRRYGFHGINHQYCARRTAELLGRDLNRLKLVTCHLGNGCSLAAIQDGRSLDTTLG